MLLIILSLQLQSVGKTNIDSLKQVVVKKTGVEKLILLENIADFYINNNLDSNYHYLMLLKNSVIKDKNSKYEALAYSSLGLNYFYNGKYFDAEENIQKAITIQKQIKDTTDLASSYNFMAGIYGESGQYAKSIEILYEAIKIFEKQNDQKSFVTAYNNLGFLYMRLENYDKAMEYYNKAISIIDKNKFNNNKGFLYNNIGICHKNFKQYDSALLFYNKALEEHNKHEALNAVPFIFLNIGNVFGFRLDKQDSALFYFEKGIELAKMYDTNSLPELYFSLGQLLESQKKYKKSIDAFIKSLSGAEENEDLDGQMQANFELYNVYKKTKQLPKALEYFEEYSIIKDSIKVEETKTSIARLESKFENEKNKIQIQKLREKQKADQHLKVAMLFGLALLIILLAFVIYVFFQRKKRNKLERGLLNTEKQKVEDELRYNNKQLATQALMMMQKNKMLQSLYVSFQEVAKEPPEKNSSSLNKIKNQIRQNIHSEKDWELFKLYFEQINKTFFQKLKDINPEINQHDIKLAALIKLRFNIKEAASVLNLSPNSIKGARSRLRSKLHLNSHDDLAEFIESID